MFHDNAEEDLTIFKGIWCLISFEFLFHHPQQFSPNKSYHNVHTLAFMIEMNRVREEVPATLLKASYTQNTATGENLPPNYIHFV